MKEPNGIIERPDGATIIINGGNPLPGCPNSYEEFYAFVDNANKDKDEFSEPFWGTDCGFKLDFNGPVVRVSSIFCPPKTHYGPKWDGSVEFMIGDAVIHKHTFECDTLNEVRESVEEYVLMLKQRIIDALSAAGFVFTPQLSPTETPDKTDQA